MCYEEENSFTVNTLLATLGCEHGPVSSPLLRLLKLGILVALNEAGQSVPEQLIQSSFTAIKLNLNFERFVLSLLISVTNNSTLIASTHIFYENLFFFWISIPFFFLNINFVFLLNIDFIFLFNNNSIFLLNIDFILLSKINFIRDLSFY